MEVVDRVIRSCDGEVVEGVVNDDLDRNLAIPYRTATGIYIFLAKKLLYELQSTNFQKRAHEIGIDYDMHPIARNV